MRRWGLPLTVFGVTRLLVLAAMVVGVAVVHDGPPRDIATVVLEALQRLGESRSVTGGHVGADLIVANLSFLLALGALDQLLARTGHDEETRWQTLCLLAAFPGAVVLCACSLDSLLLLLCVTGALSARRGDDGLGASPTRVGIAHALAGACAATVALTLSPTPRAVAAFAMAVALMAAGAVSAWRDLGAAYGVYATIVLAAALTSPLGWHYLALDFPVFIALGRWGRATTTGWTILAAFCAASGIFSMAVALGRLG